MLYCFTKGVLYALYRDLYSICKEASAKSKDAMARLVFFPGFLLEHLGYASSGCWEVCRAGYQNLSLCRQSCAFLQKKYYRLVCVRL